MADTRHLPVLNLIAPILAKNKPYISQEPPNDYLNRLIQLISFIQEYMTVLENANAKDFDNAVKCGIYKAQIGGNIYQFLLKTYITEMLILILQLLYVLE